MRVCRKLVLLASGAAGVGLALVAWGQQDQNGSAAIAVEERKADIVSEGVHIHADIYTPKSSTAGPLPTIIMSHGWGGTASMLRPQATDFARAGYLVVAFD